MTIGTLLPTRLLHLRQFGVLGHPCARRSISRNSGIAQGLWAAKGAEQRERHYGEITTNPRRRTAERHRKRGSQPEGRSIRGLDLQGHSRRAKNERMLRRPARSPPGHDLISDYNDEDERKAKLPPGHRIRQSSPYGVRGSGIIRSFA